MATIPTNPPSRGATGVAGAHHEAAAVPDENETLCEPRERASAIIAILLALLLALVLVAAAMCSRQGDGLGGGGAGMVAGTGFGSGSGTGVGPGSGTGSGVDGTGPGAAEDGRGLGASGDDEPAPPLGDPEGTVVGGSTGAAESPAEVPAVEIEPPKFGFTAPDAPPVPVVTPPPAAAPGTATGSPTRGASGVAGGSTGSQLRKLVENFKDSRVTINLDATSSMQASRDALAVIVPDLFATIEGGMITVKVFRDILQGEPNEVIIRPTPKSRNPKVIEWMVAKVLAVPLEGGGDAPETGYQLVIENMRRNEPGKDGQPNIEIIITDAPEKQADRLNELLTLAYRKKTRVFVIETHTEPPTRTELTAAESSP